MGMLLCLSIHLRQLMCSGENSEKLPGDVTFQAPHDLFGRAALRSAARDVGAGVGICAHPDENDGVQRTVQASVATAVKPVAARVSR